MLPESSKRSHKILALWTMLVLAFAALALGFAVKANAQEGGTAPQPTISSDKADYPPGGTVVLTGSNWQPGESVNIFVNDDAGKTWSRSVDVTADENGNIRDEFQLPSWFVAQYSVKATGAQSGEAATSFTDAAAQLQGQSNPPCSSGGQCDSGWESGNLKGWQELDEIPLRLKFPAAGTFTIDIDFDHFQTSSGSPGIQNLYGWTPASGVTLQDQPTLTTGLSGGKWRYTLTANVTNPNAILNFKGNLAAGAHNFTGSSLALGGSDVGGTVQVSKPAARPGNPDLIVDKTGPTTAGRDEVVTYTLNYQNKGTATSGATGVQLTDVLPSGVTYVAGSCSGSCTVAGNEVVWNLGSLVVGASGSRTLQVRIPADAAFGAQFTDQARIRSAENDVTPADNDDSLTTTVAFNRSPVAVNDSYTVDEDQTLTVSDGPNDVLANDSDPDNDPLTVTGNTQPQHGSVVVNANGSFTYTPNVNFNGSDSFNYTVSDGKGGTATGTVSFTVNSVNDTPTITPNIGDKTVLEDTDTGEISFTVGDADSAAGDLTVTASSSDTTLVPNDNANLILGGTGANRTIKVKPAADRFGGPATITLTVSDGSQSATETFDVNVTPVNDAPSFDVPALASPVNEDAPAQTVPNFATNISVGPFETSQTITAFQVTNNTNPSLFSAGPAIDPASGDLTYTPAANAFGTADVTVRAQDSGGTANGGFDTSTSKTFTITVNNTNDDPNAVDDTANAEENGPAVTIDVLANDDDGPDTGETLNVTSVTQPPAGEGSPEIISSGPDAGKVRFTPDANFFGQTNFNYTISDGNGGTDTATVTVDVAATNDPPEIGFTDPTGETQTVDESVTETRTYSYSLDDTDGPASEITESCGGATKVDTPEPNSFKCVFPDGPNVFTVSVTADDGQASNNTASDSIVVTVNNVAPTANDDSASANENGPAVEIDVLANDTDPANSQNETNDPLTITNVSGPPSGEGSVSIIESGQKVLFTPNPNFEGSSTSFDYTISDGNGGTDTATVTVNISNENDPPVLDLNGEDAGRDFSATFTEDDPALSIVGTTGNGALSVTDADDEDMESATATLTNRPDSNAETLSIDASAVPSISVTAYDSSSGILSLSGTATKAQYEQVLRTVKYGNTSQNPSTQNRVVEFVVNDGDADSLKPNSTVAVISVNDDPVIDEIDYGNEAPVGSVDGGPVDEGSPASIVVSASDPDNDPGELLYSFDCDNNGTFETVNPQPGDNTAECTFNDNGTYTVNVRVADGEGQDAGTATSSTQVEVINVDPEGDLGNDGPRDEGDTVRISFSGQNDPSSVDTNAGFHYAFDCAGGSLAAATYQNSGTDAFVDCTFNNGTKTVSARIIDKDDGFSEYTTEVTVDNAAPRVTPLSGPALVKESTTAERTYTFNATDAGGDELTIVVDCGENGDLVDANGTDPGGIYTYDPVTGEGSFKCIFPEGGPNGSTQSNVTVRATDSDGASDADNQVVIVTVENDNPQATFNAPGSVNEGDDIDLSLTDGTDPAGSNDTLEYRFDCDDGNGFGAWGGPTSSCPTNDNGNRTVKGQVRDEDGGQSEVYQKTVMVNNVAPKVVLSGPDKANEGDVKQYSFTVTDLGTADTFTVEQDYPTCGANGQLDSGSLQLTATGGSFECRFPDGDATTNVEIQVRDDDGALDADSQRVVIVEVANVAPVLTVAADQAADEGTGKDFDLGSFTDPGFDGPWNVTVDWGDGSADTTFDSASPGPLPQKPHTYADDGTYTVTVTVGEADDGPSDSKTFVVTVANVAPTANDDQMNTTELVDVTSNLLNNDTDPGNDLDSASLKILGANAVPPSLGPLGGVVTISALHDGNVTYAPNPGFVNVDSFRYEVCDDDGDCSSANVEVAVGPVDCNAQGVIRGTAGKDVLRGTAGNDVICAFAGNDTIYASGGNDLMIGDAGLDRMWGESGNDALRGGADTDAMDAGLGNDYVTGDTGRDVMMGRGGTDFLEMRDGSAGDAGNGGAGTDTCAKDQGDRTVSCERQ